MRVAVKATIAQASPLSTRRRDDEVTEYDEDAGDAHGLGDHQGKRSVEKTISVSNTYARPLRSRDVL